MKKILILFISYFLFINSSFALQQEILLGCNTSACESTQNFDIVPEKFDVTNFFIYARGDMSACNSEYVTLDIGANQYNICTGEDSDIFKLVYDNENLNFNGLDNIDFTSLSTSGVNYGPNGMTNYYEVKIVIDYTIIDNTPPNGSGAIIINNINNDPGINKEVFDLVTIKEIFEYEAIMMVFILLWTFFHRVIGRRKHIKHFNW